MTKLTIFMIVLSLVIVGVVIAQPTIIPSSFTLNPNWNLLPTPQENQKIFGCRYQFPIELRDIEVYDYTVEGANININASFKLYTGNKTSTCSVKSRVITVNLASWQNSLASYIVTTSSNNITTHNPTGSTPISVGVQG